jgi:hypothetical protein
MLGNKEKQVFSLVFGGRSFDEQAVRGEAIRRCG